MNEFDREVLRANGYDYTTTGGIIDENGNFLSSVVLNGKTYYSNTNVDNWKKREERRKTGFSLFYSKHFPNFDKFRKFEEDPLNTVLTEEDKKNYPNYLYKKRNIDLNLPEYYNNVEEFEKNIRLKYEEENPSTVEEEESSVIESEDSFSAPYHDTSQKEALVATYDNVKSSFKTVYKYPVVLGVSIIIYLIIKRLIK